MNSLLRTAGILCMVLTGTIAAPFEMRSVSEEETATSKRMMNKDTGKEIFVEPEILIDQRDVQKVELASDPSGPRVSIKLTETGSQKLKALTARSHGPFAILCQGTIISALYCETPISGGVVDIRGKFSVQEAKGYVETINRALKGLPMDMDSARRAAINAFLDTNVQWKDAFEMRSSADEEGWFFLFIATKRGPDRDVSVKVYKKDGRMELLVGA